MSLTGAQPEMHGKDCKPPTSRSPVHNHDLTNRQRGSIRVRRVAYSATMCTGDVGGVERVQLRLGVLALTLVAGRAAR
jgi:hypothetical protein